MLSLGGFFCYYLVMRSICTTEDCPRFLYCKGLCRRCYNAAYHTTNREKLCENLRKRRDDPDFVKSQAAYMAEYRKQPEYREKKRLADAEIRKNPEYRARMAAKTREKKRFFPAALVRQCREYQQGYCAVCPVKLAPGVGSNQECADHCHETKTPRGLLCGICNKSLGMYEKYLRPHKLLFPAFEEYLTNTPVSRVMRG